MARRDIELAREINRVAGEIGVDPIDLATAISYETAGTFGSWTKGPTTKWGEHRGLIQWGEPQREQYGVTKDTSVADQMTAVGQYLVDNGVRPGAGLLDIYSAINAGGVGPAYYGRSDAKAGGAPGTVRQKVEQQMAGHRANAEALFGRVDAVSQLSRSEVKSLQKALNAAGFTDDSGKKLSVDGKVGARTEEAMARALESINTMTSDAPRETVRAVQAALHANGIGDAQGNPISVDGVLGPRTAEAIQRAVGFAGNAVAEVFSPTAQQAAAGPEFTGNMPRARPDPTAVAAAPAPAIAPRPVETVSIRSAPQPVDHTLSTSGRYLPSPDMAALLDAPAPATAPQLGVSGTAAGAVAPTPSASAEVAGDPFGYARDSLAYDSRMYAPTLDQAWQSTATPSAPQPNVAMGTAPAVRQDVALGGAGSVAPAPASASASAQHAVETTPNLGLARTAPSPFDPTANIETHPASRIAAAAAIPPSTIAPALQDAVSTRAAQLASNLEASPQERIALGLATPTAPAIPALESAAKDRAMAANNPAGKLFMQTLNLLSGIGTANAAPAPAPAIQAPDVTPAAPRAAPAPSMGATTSPRADIPTPSIQGLMTNLASLTPQSVLSAMPAPSLKAAGALLGTPEVQSLVDNAKNALGIAPAPAPAIAPAPAPTMAPQPASAAPPSMSDLARAAGTGKVSSLAPTPISVKTVPISAPPVNIDQTLAYGQVAPPPGLTPAPPPSPAPQIAALPYVATQAPAPQQPKQEAVDPVKERIEAFAANPMQSLKALPVQSQRELAGMYFGLSPEDKKALQENPYGFFQSRPAAQQKQLANLLGIAPVAAAKPVGVPVADAGAAFSRGSGAMATGSERAAGGSLTASGDRVPGTSVDSGGRVVDVAGNVRGTNSFGTGIRGY